MRPMPAPIPDTPENVAGILMDAAQRERSEWEFIKEQDKTNMSHPGVSGQKEKEGG